MSCIPTPVEQAKIAQLKSTLEEHLKATPSNNAKVRAELQKIVADPDFLFKYLRGRKLNVTRAFETILKYAEVKCITFPEYFPAQVPDYVRHCIESKILNLITKKDKLGRTYVVVDTTKFDDSIVTVIEATNALRYIFEALMNYPDFLDNGVVIMENAGGIKMSHGKGAPTVAGFYTNFWVRYEKFSKAFPGKLKELIYFNAPFYGKGLFAVGKPLFKIKAADRVFVSSGLTELHKRVPLDVIPKCYGGTLPDEVAYMPTEKLLAMTLKNR
ncbi:Retinaldehyde-binding protein 1 [Orchesella cincta]|uniref:Retinaldehyde-binding protein 1 n=1 Tax=Orchesella cincta TaxID=48709 RepID=A0A1D2MP60_ORCCI|nr:Retinaldehyde-binding protein 1 [Orchesella cincta]